MVLGFNIGWCKKINVFAFCFDACNLKYTCIIGKIICYLYEKIQVHYYYCSFELLTYTKCNCVYTIDFNLMPVFYCWLTYNNYSLGLLKCFQVWEANSMYKSILLHTQA